MNKTIQLLSKSKENLLSPNSHKQNCQHILSKIYENQQYFSPFKMSTQEQIIDQIQSLGDEILSFQEDLSSKKQSQRLIQIIDSHHRSLGKKIAMTTKPKLNSNIKYTSKQQMLLKRQQKQVKVITKQQKHDFNKNTSWNPNFSKNYPVKNKDQEYQNQEQTKQTINKVKLKQKYSQVNPKLYDPKVQSNYKRFIDKNMQKLIIELKNEKQVFVVNKNMLQNNKKIYQHNVSQKRVVNQTKKFMSRLERSEQTSLMSSRQKLNQTFSTLYTNSKFQLQKKKQKIDQLRSQEYRKQMQGVTFQPQSYTQKYKPSTTLIKHEKNLNNFYQRLKTANQARDNNQLRKLVETMQQFPFKPRLNVSTKCAQSIVKNIWDSTQKYKPKQTKNTRNNRSIQRLTQSMYISQGSSLLPYTLKIPVHSTKQLNFLF